MRFEIALMSSYLFFSSFSAGSSHLLIHFFNLKMFFNQICYQFHDKWGISLRVTKLSIFQGASVYSSLAFFANQIHSAGGQPSQIFLFNGIILSAVIVLCYRYPNMQPSAFLPWCVQRWRNKSAGKSLHLFISERETLLVIFWLTLWRLRCLQVATKPSFLLEDSIAWWLENYVSWLFGGDVHVGFIH